MRIIPATLAVCLAGFVAAAQQAGPALTIDANAGQHAISPDIYGINFFWDSATATTAGALALRPTVRRWGGDNTSDYNWQLGIWNIDSDWFFEELPSAATPSNSFNLFADQARITGGKILGTVPILGWLPNAVRQVCSYNTAKYGPQCKEDQYWPNCGNGIVWVSSCGTPTVQDGKTATNPQYIKNDPTDAYAQFDQSFQQQWVASVVSRYGPGNQGGVAIWSLDNEPIWWDDVHMDIHPNPYTYDENLALDTTYAAAIKAADPTALVSGPVADNWASLFFSKTDILAGWSSPNANYQYWGNPVDRNAHNGVPFLSWYLQQMQQYQQQHGTRLLDYLDVHAYYQPDELSNPESPTVDALRLDSTREFWDPTYSVSILDKLLVDTTNNGAPVAPMLIPRLQQIVSQNYPGTKIAISEYNWTGAGTLNGALTEAEILGIFGWQGLDMATYWGPPGPADPVAFAFQMYRNYDGIGGAFGETSVQATSADRSSLSVYGALRSDLNLTALVINKTGTDLSTTLSLANFSAGPSAHVWQYSGASNAIVGQPDVPVAANALAAVFPANSITMLAIPPASLPVPKPVVQAVTNAASYGAAIAPGQIVDIWGSGLGPATLTKLALDANGMVSTSLANVRVLFDGIPAPLVYVSATQCSAVVPYFGAVNPTTHVQVEYQGALSDPLPVPVSATAPGLFTANSSGTGQGSILNQDQSINSVSNPAAVGSIVVLYATGEGVTDPPGVDGRPAVDVFPAPLASVTVNIGGFPAVLKYAGAAPGYLAGLLQINAQMSSNVAAGNAVPVHVTIGGVTSQDGVTLVVH